MMVHRAGTRAAAAGCLVALVGPARAGTPRNTPAAIDVDRDDAPAGRIGVGFDGGEPVDAWGVSLAGAWLERPIEIPAGAFGAGARASQPVRRRQTLAFGAAIALGDRIVLDVRLRGSHQVGERLAAAGDPAPLARFVFHDLRFGGRIRVAGNASRAAFLRAELTLPTGDDAQLAGDARWTAAWSLLGRARLPHEITVAATAGIRLHGAEVVVGDRLVGDELFGAAGIAVPLPIDPLNSLTGPVQATAELIGSYGDHVGTRAGPDPLEARLGVQLQPRQGFAVGVHAGFGLDDQIGAPAFRAVIEFGWTPQLAHRPDPVTPEPGDDSDDDSSDPDGSPTASITPPS